MLILLVSSLFVLQVSSEDYVHNPIQYHRQNPRSGSYNYGYDTGLFGSHSFHQENRDANSGQVRGRYGYTDPDGKLRLTHYTAGPQGFNVIPDTESTSSISKPTSVVPSYHRTEVRTVEHHEPAHHDSGHGHHVNEVPVAHHSRPTHPCKGNKLPCPGALQQHHDDKVSVSYSTSTKTSHQQKHDIVVQEKPIQEVITTHHAPQVVHHPLPRTPPKEHNHHHLHHRNHDAHIGLLPPPPPVTPPVAPVVHHEPAVVVHSTSEVHSPSVVVDERRTHHLQKTTVSVQEPLSKTIIHEPISVKTVHHEPPAAVKQVVHHEQVVKQTSHRSPKAFYSPTEVFRSKSSHHQTQTVVSHEDTKGIPQEYLEKGRYVPNFKPAGQYSKCYCI